MWNYCVGLEKDRGRRYRAGSRSRRRSSHFDLVRLTSGVGKELGISQQSVGLVCKEFVRGRDERKKCPRYRKSAGPRRSLGWLPFPGQQIKVEGNSVVYLSKRFRFWLGHRPVPEKVKCGVFVQDARGRWYVSFIVDVPEKPKGNGAIGIDLGIKSLATLSSGRKIDAAKALVTHAAQLATAQRARRRKRVAAIHAKIAAVRRDHAHKATAEIARSYAVIAVGDVPTRPFTKTRLAKAVLDVGWGMFRRQLRYKASRHGADYIEVPERFTTRTCSCCGAIPNSSPKGIGAIGIRAWECSDCGASHDRDVNAARNILALALSAQRPVEGSRPTGWIGTRCINTMTAGHA